MILEAAPFVGLYESKKSIQEEVKNMKVNETTQRFLNFVDRATTAFQTVDEISAMLEEKGFQNLSVQKKEKSPICAGGNYFLTCNRSSLIAFSVPKDYVPTFSVMASHSDSPMLKIKENAEHEAAGHYITLDTERYGGTIYSTWFDRPLSLAGRVIVRKTVNGEQYFESKSVVFDRDLLVIPNVAIHMQKNINEECKYQAHIDLQPLFSLKEKKPSLKTMTAELLNVAENDIKALELYVVNRTHGCIFGADGEFFASPRIDNLQCAYATLQGFLKAKKYKNIAVYAIFDNEEVGSATKMGAASSFFFETLSKIAKSLDFDLSQAITSSFLISADNAHALHPNHPELSDTKRAPVLNHGIVLKHNACQRYTTEAISATLVTEIAKKADVPIQLYANRSDMLGGSTLGAITTTKVGMTAADIGLPQLAMHSSYETAGSADTDYLIRFSQVFYESDASMSADGIMKM